MFLVFLFQQPNELIFKAIELSIGLRPPPKTSLVSKLITIPSLIVSFAFYISPSKFCFLFIKIYIFCLFDLLFSAHSPKIKPIGASKYV